MTSSAAFALTAAKRAPGRHPEGTRPVGAGRGKPQQRGENRSGVHPDSVLASDLPATASGAPAHKAGARIAVITDTKAPDGTSVGFTTPSAAAMALNSAMRAVEQSQALRETFIYDEVKTPRGPGRAIRQERELFDY